MIDVKVRSLRLEPQKFQINCVDFTTKEVLGVWSIRVITSPPVIDKTFRVPPVKVNTEQHF